MHTRSRFPSSCAVRSCAIAALVLLAKPLAVRAQQTITRVQIEARRVSLGNARADTLEAEALTLQDKPRKYIDAARLHRRAGLLRGSDPRAVESFRRAAWLYSAVGDNRTACEMMEQAAERATRVGDVEKAANSYVDATLLAVASGRKDKIPSILGRMHAVLSSPLLSAPRRARIVQRIKDSPTLAQLDTVMAARR